MSTRDDAKRVEMLNGGRRGYEGMADLLDEWAAVLDIPSGNFVNGDLRIAAQMLRRAALTRLEAPGGESDGATPRPWASTYDDNGFFYIHAPGAPSPYIVATGGESSADKANVALIVQAVNALAAPAAVTPAAEGEPRHPSGAGADGSRITRGTRIITPDDRVGTAGEVMSDGDVDVRYDDGTFGQAKWARCRAAAPASPSALPGGEELVERFAKALLAYDIPDLPWDEACISIPSQVAGYRRRAERLALLASPPPEGVSAGLSLDELQEIEGALGTAGYDYSDTIYCTIVGMIEGKRHALAKAEG